jgi:hypothetical protein
MAFRCAWNPDAGFDLLLRGAAMSYVMGCQWCCSNFSGLCVAKTLRH